MRLQLQIVALGLALVSPPAWGKEMFNGNETILQIVDKLKASQDGMYDRHVIVHAGAISLEGFITGIGNSFLILESETGRSTVATKPQKIYAQRLIMLSSITGFEFKVSK